MFIHGYFMVCNFWTNSFRPYYALYYNQVERQIHMIPCCVLPCLFCLYKCMLCDMGVTHCSFKTAQMKLNTLMSLKVLSYNTTIALRCHTAPFCTEIVMSLHYMRWCCMDLGQKVINISTPKRKVTLVWTDLYAIPGAYLELNY